MEPDENEEEGEQQSRDRKQREGRDAAEGAASHALARFYAAFFCCSAGAVSPKSRSAFSRIRSGRGLALLSFASRIACDVRSTTTSGLIPPSLIGLRSGVV